VSAPRGFQFVWYGWYAWRRCYFERFTNGLRFVYSWRLAVGPFEIRRWQPRSYDEVRGDS
jgi:hypothetical protein